MSHILARSISQYLLDAGHVPATLRVLSRHRRVVNLMDEEGSMWAVVHPRVGNGPFHIVLASAIAFDAWAPGMDGRWDGRVLTVGGWRVDATPARAWDAFLARTPLAIPDRSWELARGCADDILAASPPQAEMDARTWARLQEGAAALGAASRSGDEALAREGARLLAGLGPGLTPAGDDVLLGWMARRWMSVFGVQYSVISDDMDRIFESVAGRTTRVSEAWLRHAATGRFAEPWHDLRLAMSRGDGEAICRAMLRIADIGATSGRLALLGAFSMP